GNRPGDPGATDGDAIPALASPDAEGEARVEDAHVANVDPLEPRRERRIEQEPLGVQVRLHAEERPQAQEHHSCGPGLRDARDEVVGGPRRKSQVALKATPQLRKLGVREAATGLDQGAHHLGRLLAVAVTSETLNDERVVVWPDRAVVVAYRVVGRVFARERTDAPARVDVEIHEMPRAGSATLG